MGCALSAADDAEKKRSEAIDKSLAADRLSRKDEIKLLLLGEWCGPSLVGSGPLEIALVWNVSLACFRNVTWTESLADIFSWSTLFQHLVLLAWLDRLDGQVQWLKCFWEGFSLWPHRL